MDLFIQFANIRGGEQAVRESYETQTKTAAALIEKTLTGTLSHRPLPDVPSGINERRRLDG